MRLIIFWYAAVMVVLADFLFETVVSPVFSSLFFWLRLIFASAALIGSFFVLADYHPKMRRENNNYQQVRSSLLAELKKRDAEIRRLRGEREMLLNTAIKQAAKTVEMRQLRITEKEKNR